MEVCPCDRFCMYKRAAQATQMNAPAWHSSAAVTFTLQPCFCCDTALFACRLPSQQLSWLWTQQATAVTASLLLFFFIVADACTKALWHQATYGALTPDWSRLFRAEYIRHLYAGFVNAWQCSDWLPPVILWWHKHWKVQTGVVDGGSGGGGRVMCVCTNGLVVCMFIAMFTASVLLA